MRTNRLLGAGLFALGALVIVYAVLGPLVLDVIHFRTTASGLNQIRGGDLAALVVVVPVCMAVGWLAWQGHPAAPVLALAPAIFAMYMYSQLILGNEFLQLPGNVERFFGLLLAMFLLATVVAVRCWGLARPEELPPSTRRLERGSGILLVVIAAFVVFGMHLPTLVDALRPDDPENRSVGAPHASRPLLWRWPTVPECVPLAQALLGGDPNASLAQAIGMTGLASAGAVFAYFLYRPLFRPITTAVPDARVLTGADPALAARP